MTNKQNVCARATLSAVIPTMDRYVILKQTLPRFTRHGFDEIIVVDSSSTGQRKMNEELCRRLGVKYFYFFGNRENARNFGVAQATSEWVFIYDDDIMLLELDMKNLRETLTSGNYDFCHGSSECVWLFKKAFFLEIGGYDAKLCLGDDFDIPVRAYKYGKPCKLAEDPDKIVEIKKTRKMQWKGIFSYSLTILAFFKKYPLLRTALQYPYRTAYFWKELLQKRTSDEFVNFVLTVAGSLLSPLYLLDSEFFNEFLLKHR